MKGSTLHFTQNFPGLSHSKKNLRYNLFDELNTAEESHLCSCPPRGSGGRTFISNYNLYQILIYIEFIYNFISNLFISNLFISTFILNFYINLIYNLFAELNTAEESHLCSCPPRGSGGRTLPRICCRRRSAWSEEVFSPGRWNRTRRGQSHPARLVQRLSAQKSNIDKSNDKRLGEVFY